MGPCEGNDGTPVPTGTVTAGTETDPAGAVPMGTDADTTALEVYTIGTEAEITSLDVYTTGTLVSADGTASGVVTGLNHHQHAARRTASAVGVPRGTVHDRLGDNRLGQSTRAVGDHQGGGLGNGELAWVNIFGALEFQLNGGNSSNARFEAIKQLTLVTV